MYRPWWFPEYNPSQQRMFDTIVAILQKTYEKWQYTHVLTPSVEPVDILKRGGDIIDKQVYWLYGLAQGPEDTKEYALHFDLTVPFARYTLDHMHELTFPFKRYQMQPVWRGERTKRGRYKEFWQFDVDTIWRSETDVGVWYDAESIIVTYQALAEIFATFGIQRKLAVHISNIAVTKSYLTSLGIVGDVQKNVCKLLDDYYKVPHEVFVEKLSAHADAAAVDAIAALVQSRDHNDPALRACDAWGQLDEVLGYLAEFDIPATYDLAIMRGHGYYTGTVVEIFLPDDMALGAISGGGAYRNMTDFIDPKHSFSGVGCSISSRIMELVMEMEGKLGKRGESYMFLHFTETRKETLALMQHFQAAGKSCQLYSCDAKFGKQLQYADNVGCTHAVILGTDELARGEFLVKDLTSGEMLTGKMDAAYGVIPVCEIDGVKKILLMLGKPSGHRGFPKGHAEWDEDGLTAARRESLEETGISDAVIDAEKSCTQRYIITRASGSVHKDGAAVLAKTVTYYAAQVKDPAVTFQEKELYDGRWFTVEEALALPMYGMTRDLIEEVAKGV